MDGFQKANPEAVFGMVQGMGTAAVVIAGCCSLACSAVFLTFVIYLAIYAFANPDSETWIGTVAGPTDQATGLAGPDIMKFGTEESLTAEGATDMLDIHARFVTFFTWGFLNTALCCGFCCTGVLMSRCVPALVGCCFALSSCTQCSSTIWYIMGLVWRLNEAGKFASGDNLTEEELTAEQEADSTLYQLKSGNFMWTYFVISWIMMGTSCVCGCLMPCIIGCLSR